MGKRFFISGSTPSSKNNQIITEYGGLIASGATQKWKRVTVSQWVAFAIEFRRELVGLTPPYFIEFTFVRNTRHKFDYHNAVQAPADAMTKYGWLLDDNTEIMKPYFGDAYLDKKNPGVYIEVLKTKPNHHNENIL